MPRKPDLQLVKGGPPAWAPQPGETPDEFVRFQCYLNSDPRPDISRAPLALAKGWLARAAEYDRYLSGQDVLSQTAQHRRRRAMAVLGLLRELALVEAQKHYAIAVQSAAPATTLDALAKVVERVVRAEQALTQDVGPAEGTQDLSRLSDQELADLDRLLEKASG